MVLSAIEKLRAAQIMDICGVDAESLAAAAADDNDGGNIGGGWGIEYESSGRNVAAGAAALHCTLDAFICFVMIPMCKIFVG